MKHIFIVLLVLSSLVSNAQNGKVRGTIFDNTTGETLVGVTIAVKGTTTGTSTDLDGEFTLNLPGGVYDLQISFISYQTIIVEGIAVKPNEVTIVGNIKLMESTL